MTFKNVASTSASKGIRCPLALPQQSGDSAVPEDWRAALPAARPSPRPFVVGKVTKTRRNEAGGGKAERMAAEGRTLLKSLGGQVFSDRFFSYSKNRVFKQRSMCYAKVLS